MKMLLSLACLWLAGCSEKVAEPALPAVAEAAPSAPVAARETVVSLDGKGVAVRATIATLPWRPSTPSIFADPAWYLPKNQVVAISISVNGTPVAVPTSAVLSLYDFNRATLKDEGQGLYALDIQAGDGAMSYKARLLFNKDSVETLTIREGEGGQVVESTTYRVSTAFDDA